MQRRAEMPFQHVKQFMLGAALKHLCDEGTARRQHLHGGLIGAGPGGGGACELWVTGRMTHVFALGEMLGHPRAGEFVEHGLAALRGRLRDPVHGGWFAAVDGPNPDDRKPFYQHCFVLLGAASARVATLFPKPTDAKIKERIEDAVYGIGPGTFNIPTPTTGTLDGATYLDLKVTYTQKTDLLLLPGPTISVSRSKRVWIAT